MARALVRRGHKVTVACYAHGLGEPHPSLRVVRTPAVPGYDNLRAGPDLVKPLLDAALALRLCLEDADIVHAHNYEAPIAAYIARALRGTPVVYNTHNTMAEELHTYFEGELSRRIARVVGRTLDRTVPRLADACVAISEDAVGILEALGCQRVTHVPPGVDPEDLVTGDAALVRERYGLGDRVWVVYAGNPDAYQDLGDLVDAVLQLDDVGLLMVSASGLERWEERARALPEARKRFVVTPHWPEVRELVAASDIAALPRRVCSGYPIKLLNSLGLGIPTVCARGSSRPIQGIVTVPNGDPAAIAEALHALSQDPHRRLELGRAAALDIRTHHTWDARAAELETVYAQVLGYGPAL